MHNSARCIAEWLYAVEIDLQWVLLFAYLWLPSSRIKLLWEWHQNYCFFANQVVQVHNTVISMSYIERKAKLHWSSSLLAFDPLLFLHPGSFAKWKCKKAKEFHFRSHIDLVKAVGAVPWDFDNIPWIYLWRLLLLRKKFHLMPLRNLQCQLCCSRFVSTGLDTKK